MARLDIIEASKQLRKELKEKFPSVKFSVRIDRFSMGESIDVRWLDGPATVLVDRIVEKYSDIDRDPASGEILSGGNRYVNATREYSPAIQKQITEEFNQGKYPGYPTEWNVLCMTDFYQGKAPRTYTREEIFPAKQEIHPVSSPINPLPTIQAHDSEEVKAIVEQARGQAEKLRYIQ